MSDIQQTRQSITKHLLYNIPIGLHNFLDQSPTLIDKMVYFLALKINKQSISTWILFLLIEGKFENALPRPNNNFKAIRLNK